jgi:hypothetical protein
MKVGQYVSTDNGLYGVITEIKKMGRFGLAF